MVKSVLTICGNQYTIMLLSTNWLMVHHEAAYKIRGENDFGSPPSLYKGALGAILGDQ